MLLRHMRSASTRAVLASSAPVLATRRHGPPPLPDPDKRLVHSPANARAPRLATHAQRAALPEAADAARAVHERGGRQERCVVLRRELPAGFEDVEGGREEGRGERGGGAWWKGKRGEGEPLRAGTRSEKDAPATPPPTAPFPPSPATPMILRPRS